MPNVPKVELPGIEVAATGQGSGLLGLPGDYTPPSRFVRAVGFTQAAAEPGGGTTYETTQWMTVRDLTNRKLYLRIREVDLQRLDFGGDSVKKIPLNEPETFEDVTERAV